MSYIKNLIDGIGIGRFMSVLGTIVIGIISLIYLFFRLSQPEMELLFSQLDPAEGGRIIEKLKVLTVPNEVRGDGTQIYVPSGEVARLRMELAQDGLPSGGAMGYELFDKSDMLGSTSAMMDLNLMRALEGELAKSIRTIQGVQSARVHLVMPKRELFSKEKQEPSASIVIKMKSSLKLSANQAQAIQHLVAASVPNLLTEKISIIDDKGRLVVKGYGGKDEKSDQLDLNVEVRQRLEQKMARTVENLLDKTLGDGKSRVEISLEIDFDKVTSTSVEFNPDGQVVRSAQNSQEGMKANEGAADAVTIQNSLPDQGQGSASAGSKSQTTKSDENTTYEISNTTKTHVKESGRIQRLSVAVLVDGAETTDKKYQPRKKEEIDQLVALVKTAVGFKQSRGDEVKVINMPFEKAVTVSDKEVPEPFWKKMDLARTLQLLLLGILGLLSAIFVIRPLIQGIQSGGGGRGRTFSSAGSNVLIDDMDDDDLNVVSNDLIRAQAIDRDTGKVKIDPRQRLDDVVSRKPSEAAAVVKTWMYQKRQEDQEK